MPRGRRKLASTNVQTNTLLGYIAPPADTGEKICRSLIDDLLQDILFRSETDVKQILDDVLDRVCPPVTKKKHDGIRVNQKTISEWKTKFPWLIINETSTNMRCEICTKMKSKLKLTCVWAHEGSPNIQISGITRHNQSTEHTNACSALEKQNVEVLLEKENVSDLSPISISKADKIVFNTVYYAAKSEIPTINVNGLLDLQTKNGLDVKYTNLSWHSINEMQSAIVHVLKDEIVDEIKSSGVFALMLDESTDVTVEKRLSMCVRYVKGGEPMTKFLCNVPISDGCAHTIVNCVAKKFEKLGVNLANCTSLATDGAAAMMGKRTGAGKQMISKYSPFCVQTHCMAHRLNLACTDSIKKNEFMVKFRDKFASLYFFVSASSVRTLALKNIQKLLEEPELSIKEPYSVRWLGLRNAVQAVFESFASVLATLSKFAAEKKDVAKGLFKYFRSYKVALVIAMVLDVHNELAILSCELQKKNLLFSEIRPLMDATVSKLTFLESNDGECLVKMRLEMQKRDDGMFYGEEKLIYYDRMDSEFESIRKDYIQRLKKNISNRFRKEDSAVFEDFSKLFEPSLVNMSSQEASQEALESLSALYGYEKSVTIVHGDLTEGTEEEKEIVKPLLDPQKLQAEWPKLQGMIRGSYANMSTDKLCKRIILLHKDIVPNFSTLAKIALCLQPTSVECERSFSSQNRLKSKYRASLGSEKLNLLLTISMLGPSVSSYDPSAAVTYWIRQKRRRKSRLCMDYKPRPAKQKKMC